MDWVNKSAPARRGNAVLADAAYRKKATVDPGGLNIRPKRKR